MISNYLKVAFRNLRKYKAFTFINVAGLAIGRASVTESLFPTRRPVESNGH